MQRPLMAPEGWWTISSEDLLDILVRVHRGADPVDVLHDLIDTARIGRPTVEDLK